MPDYVRRPTDDPDRDGDNLKERNVANRIRTIQSSLIHGVKAKIVTDHKQPATGQLFLSLSRGTEPTDDVRARFM